MKTQTQQTASSQAGTEQNEKAQQGPNSFQRVMLHLQCICKKSCRRKKHIKFHLAGILREIPRPHLSPITHLPYFGQRPQLPG